MEIKTIKLEIKYLVLRDKKEKKFRQELISCKEETESKELRIENEYDVSTGLYEAYKRLTKNVYFYESEGGKCLEPCPFKTKRLSYNERVKIGSLTCQECENMITFDIDRKFIVCKKDLKDVVRKEKKLRHKK